MQTHLNRIETVFTFVLFTKLNEVMTQIAKLALEDGTVFTGEAFGASGEVDGEVVFNTSMTG